MLKHLFPLIIFFVFLNLIKAEGTHELAPNRSIYIHDTLTTDVAALYIGDDFYNNFALFGNDNKYSQLYINIQNPSQECIYLGFSQGHTLNGRNPESIAFTFVIKDPNGNIVYGPKQITPSEANIHNWSEAYNGPQSLTSNNGYNPFIIKSSDLMSQGWSGDGNYYIQFDYNIPNVTDKFDGFLIDFWDINVVDCSSTIPVYKKGRIWAYSWSLWAINDFGFPERPFNGKFYICAVDSSNRDAAFISSIDFNNSGFRPAGFSIAFNSYGTRNTGNVQYNRKSVSNKNLTTGLYPIFLNDPVDIYGTPKKGSIEFIKLERGVNRNMCFRVKATQSGVVEILLDFHKGDGVYSESTEDVLLSAYISSDQAGSIVCIPWGGTDGEGTPIIDESFPIKIIYNRGIFHFPIYDAEYLTEGFQLKRVHPKGPTPKLFYDDTFISEGSGTDQPKKNLSGCIIPCHTWNNFTSNDVIGYGNLNTINSWWYSKRYFLKKRVTVTIDYYIPNAFTPNGDGINERATVFLDNGIVGVKKFEIFDRWGNRVYEEKHENSVKELIGWNGRYKNQLLNPAVFMYKVTIEIYPGVTIIDHGTLTLIR